jgi:hypothetical protein
LLLLLGLGLLRRRFGIVLRRNRGQLGLFGPVAERPSDSSASSTSSSNSSAAATPAARLPNSVLQELGQGKGPGVRVVQQIHPSKRPIPRRKSIAACSASPVRHQLERMDRARIDVQLGLHAAVDKAARIVEILV